MGTTWGPVGCGDHMGTTGMWRPHGDNMETTWGQHGDNMRTMWRQHEDHRGVETTRGQHGDNMRTMWIIQFCLKIYDL